MLIIIRRVLKIIAIIESSLYFVMLHILIKVVEAENEIQACEEFLVIKSIMF